MQKTFASAFFKDSPLPFSVCRVTQDLSSKDLHLDIVAHNEAYVKTIMGCDVLLDDLFELVSRWDCSKDWPAVLFDVIKNDRSASVDLQARYDTTVMRAFVFRLDDKHAGIIFCDTSKEHALQSEVDAFLSVNIDILCVVGTDGRLLKVNREFETMLGYDKAELEGRDVNTLLHPDDIDPTRDAIRRLKEPDAVAYFTNRNLSKDGTYRYLQWRAQRRGDLIFISGRDITDNMAQTKALVERAAHDALTGLYNRHTFDVYTTEIYEDTHSDRLPVSLLLIDLDRFGNVNDTYGQPVGDLVLMHIARCLQNHLRSTDFAARIGGAKFAVIMPDTTEEGAIAAGNKLRSFLLSSPHETAGIVTASFGAATYARGETIDQWRLRADTALYLAKQAGRNQVVGSEASKARDLLTKQPTWDLAINSGHERLDLQNQELLELGNSLVAAYTADDTKAELDLLDALIAALDQHFRTEESILFQHKYADATEHAAIHAKLQQQAACWMKIRTENRVYPPAFYSFLIDEVILKHVDEEDRRFFNLFA